MRLTDVQMDRLKRMRNAAKEIDSFGGNPALYWSQYLSRAVSTVLDSPDDINPSDLAWLEAMNVEYNSNPVWVRKSENL